MYGDHWTPARVLARLMVAWRRLPDTPIYSPVLGVLEPTFWHQEVDGLRLLTAVAHYCGARSALRHHLLLHVRARVAGYPILHLCREHGWSRATHYRYIERALAMTSRGLNRDRKPMPPLVPTDIERAFSDERWIA